MQLPMSSIKSRLEEVFNCLEKQSERWMTLASSSSPSANYKGNSFDGVPCRIEQQQQQSVANDVFIQLEAERKALEEDRQRAAAGIWSSAPAGSTPPMARTSSAPSCGSGRNARNSPSWRIRSAHRRALPGSQP